MNMQMYDSVYLKREIGAYVVGITICKNCYELWKAKIKKPISSEA